MKAEVRPEPQPEHNSSGARQDAPTPKSTNNLDKGPFRFIYILTYVLIVINLAFGVLSLVVVFMASGVDQNLAMAALSGCLAFAVLSAIGNVLARIGNGLYAKGLI